MARKKGKKNLIPPPKPKPIVSPPGRLLVNQNPAQEQSAIDRILEELPEEKRIELTSFMQAYSGPIPPPDILKGIEDIVPGGADRVIRMAENQAAHRQKMEATIVKRDYNQAGIAQWMAFFLTIILIGAGLYCVHIKDAVTAGIIFGTTIAGLATIFVLRKKELSQQQ